MSLACLYAFHFTPCIYPHTTNQHPRSQIWLYPVRQLVIQRFKKRLVKQHP